MDYFVPDHKDANLSYYQQVLTGEKKVLLIKHCHPIEPPTWPEITVKNLYEAIKKDQQLMKYIPDQTAGKKLKLSKYFLWNVIMALRPKWGKMLVNSCIEARNKVSDEEARKRKIVPISAEVIEMLFKCLFV